MKKKSLSAKKTTHKLLLNYLNNKKISKVYKEFKNYLDVNVDEIFPKFGVAVSGGPDSLALAFLSKCYFLKKKLNGKFFIVDHKLRKDSSKEAKTVKLLLKRFDIDCKVLVWKGKKPFSNIQSISRNKRYNLLKKNCKKNNINNLLVGHHIDDLYENFFIRLLRGSGLRGLSSFGEPIKEEENNISIFRPLIKIEKKDLIHISKKVFKFFVKDPTNQNFIFKRSRVRKIISELNNEGFDKKKLYLTVKNLKSANQAINFYVKQNIKNNSKFIEKKNTYILNKDFFNQAPEVTFRSFSSVLIKVSGKYYSPRGTKITDAISKILYIVEPKVKKFTLGGCYIEKINKTILITKEN